jgi:acyl carrier protein
MMVANRHSFTTRESLALPQPYVAPEGELETLIATIFAEIFALDQVGANDEFFDLGGDSLLAEVLSTAISEQTQCKFRTSQLLECGSPKRIAAALK